MIGGTRELEEHCEVLGLESQRMNVRDGGKERGLLLVALDCTRITDCLNASQQNRGQPILQCKVHIFPSLPCHPRKDRNKACLRMSRISL
jgi:hypothetical protein